MNEEQFQQLLGSARFGEAPAVLAAVDQDPGLVTRVSENHRYGEEETLLHMACQGGHLDLSRDLLDRRADLHYRNAAGRDALMVISHQCEDQGPGSNSPHRVSSFSRCGYDCSRQ